MQMFVCSPVKTALQPQITVHFLANYAQWVAYYFTLNISLGYETLFIDSSGLQSLGAALERKTHQTTDGRGGQMVKEERRRNEQNNSVKKYGIMQYMLICLFFFFNQGPTSELCVASTILFFKISWTLHCFLCPMRKSTKQARAWASRAD